MVKIDGLLNRALRAYNEARLNRNVAISRLKELSELELEVQGLLQKENIMPNPLQIHSKSKKSVSPEKVAYCFFNFPLKFDPSELSGLTSVSAFDMIDFVTRIVYDAQSYEGQKVMSNFDGQISGPKIIYNKISSFRSKELFICKLENGNCHWNLYLPIVYSNGNWEEQQPEEVIKPDNFFIDRRLFEISRLDEMRFISKPYQGGIKWVKGKNRVYFGNMLVEHMEMVESMPKED